MKIGKKILGVVSILMFCALGTQAFLSTHLMGTELERSVTANLTAKAQAAIESFNEILQSAAADLTVIGAHKSIENYLTFRVFGDDDGMTESVSELDLFLARVFRGKPQYIQMQVANRDGVVLHMENGVRAEKYKAFDSAQAFESLEKTLQAGGPTINHAVHRQGENIALLSVGAVVIENTAEGLVWLYQPLDGAVQTMFAGAADNGLSAVVSNVKGEIVVKSSVLDETQAQALAGGNLTGWVSITQALPSLNWRVTFGAEESTAFAAVGELTMTSGIVFVMALLVTSVVLVVFLRRIVKPLSEAVNVAETIATGDLSKEIEVSTKDETGQLLQAMKTMQANLKESIDTDRRMAAESGRIKSALDNVSGNVMVADAKGKIIYLNKAVEGMFRKAEQDLRREVPEFSAEALMDSELERLYEDLCSESFKLSQASNTQSAEFEVGGRTFRTVINPVFNTQGEHLGTAVEWTDRTAEVAVECEVQSIVEHAQAGDLNRRIDLAGKAGFFMKLSQGLNALIEVSEQVINDTLRVLGALADGNLTETISADYQGNFDQLKRDANATVAKLTEVISEIKKGAESVSSGAREIAQGNNTLSQRTEEQAANLEETASSMEQMTATVKQNADNARQANQLASGARKQAEKGGQVVGEAVSAMAEINTASKKIADIIGVIDEIAFQTNLLALNAAVEAARAGEQGRGFAVVASEVRNLAQRSASAAKQIKALIADSVNKVKQGSQLVDQSGQTLEEIVTSVKKVSDIVAEIASASAEQSSGIEQVNKAVMQMDEMTQQNAALVEQAAAASEAMDEQARGMKEQVEFFTLDEQAMDTVTTQDGATALGSVCIDFAETRSNHLLWKSRLRRFLDGEEAMSKDQTVSYRHCDLGKWLYSAGLEQYGQLQEMQQLEQVHKHLHEIIHRIVDLKHSGQTEQAEREFARVEPISQRIVSLLNAIEHHAKQETSHGPQQAQDLEVERRSVKRPCADRKPEVRSNPALIRVATGTGEDSQWEEY